MTPETKDPMTDAEKCRVLGEFVGIYIERSTEFERECWFVRAKTGETMGCFFSESDAWESLGYYWSREAVWPVLQKIVRESSATNDAFWNHLLASVGNTLYAIIEATPRQLFEAAVETVEEMKGVKK